MPEAQPRLSIQQELQKRVRRAPSFFRDSGVSGMNDASDVPDVPDMPGAFPTGDKSSPNVLASASRLSADADADGKLAKTPSSRDDKVKDSLASLTASEATTNGLGAGHLPASAPSWSISPSHSDQVLRAEALEASPPIYRIQSYHPPTGGMPRIKHITPDPEELQGLLANQSEDQVNLDGDSQVRDDLRTPNSQSFSSANGTNFVAEAGQADKLDSPAFEVAQIKTYYDHKKEKHPSIIMRQLHDKTPMYLALPMGEQQLACMYIGQSGKKPDILEWVCNDTWPGGPGCHYYRDQRGTYWRGEEGESRLWTGLLFQSCGVDFAEHPGGYCTDISQYSTEAQPAQNNGPKTKHEEDNAADPFKDPAPKWSIFKATSAAVTGLAMGTYTAYSKWREDRREEKDRQIRRARADPLVRMFI